MVLGHRDTAMVLPWLLGALMTKTVNDEVLEFLRTYIAGGVNQDFKLWARELYAKLYGSSAEPAAPLQISGAPFPVYDLHGKPRAPRRCPDCGVIEGDLHEDDCPIGGGAPCTFAENRGAPHG